MRRSRIGHNRPPTAEFLSSPVGPERAMDAFPAKFFEQIRDAPNTYACCRTKENLLGQWAKSRSDLDDPDRFEAVCVCGRRHRRLIVGRLTPEMRTSIG